MLTVQLVAPVYQMLRFESRKRPSRAIFQLEEEDAAYLNFEFYGAMFFNKH